MTTNEDNKGHNNVENVPKIEEYLLNTSIIFGMGIIAVCLMFLIMGGFRLTTFQAMLSPAAILGAVFTIITLKLLAHESKRGINSFQVNSRSKKIVSFSALFFSVIFLSGAALSANVSEWTIMIVFLGEFLAHIFYAIRTFASNNINNI